MTPKLLDMVQDVGNFAEAFAVHFKEAASKTFNFVDGDNITLIPHFFTTTLEMKKKYILDDRWDIAARAFEVAIENLLQKIDHLKSCGAIWNAKITITYQEFIGLSPDEDMSKLNITLTCGTINE